jgi:hypothetical protein
LNTPLRIARTLVITLAGIYLCANWVAPVALSYYATKKVSPVVRVVPTELQDKSVSAAPGKTLSYFGYEFEIPWDDLDDSQTKMFAANATHKAELHFRSGLRLIVTALPPREFVDGAAKGFGNTPQHFSVLFGPEMVQSDYDFKKSLYEFTPDQMHHWTTSQEIFAREGFLLTIKSVSLSNAASTGIFNVRNISYKGFQEGNPQVRQGEILVDLFSDEGGVEMMFLQKNYRKGSVITQPEINRVIQTLRKAPQE